MTCRFCGKRCDPSSRSVWRLVTGWEKVRASNEGVYPLKGREFAPDSYAHGLCLEVALRGGEQERLAL
jgi:hypothetical protein